jgi:hypothetical protein
MIEINLKFFNAVAKLECMFKENLLIGIADKHVLASCITVMIFINQQTLGLSLTPIGNSLYKNVTR